MKDLILLIMNSEAYLKAYLMNLQEHGIAEISIVTMLQKIEDAFHNYEAESEMNADEKKLYHRLKKSV